jgi:hypothetical protein
VGCRIVWNIKTNVPEEPAASIFRLEDRGRRFLQNAGTYIPHHMMPHLRRSKNQNFFHPHYLTPGLLVASIGELTSSCFDI